MANPRNSFSSGSLPLGAGKRNAENSGIVAQDSAGAKKSRKGKNEGALAADCCVCHPASTAALYVPCTGHIICQELHIAFVCCSPRADMLGCLLRAAYAWLEGTWCLLQGAVQCPLAQHVLSPAPAAAVLLRRWAETESKLRAALVGST